MLTGLCSMQSGYLGPLQVASGTDSKSCRLNWCMEDLPVNLPVAHYWRSSPSLQVVDPVLPRSQHSRWLLLGWLLIVADGRAMAT